MTSVQRSEAEFLRRVHAREKERSRNFPVLRWSLRKPRTVTAKRLDFSSIKHQNMLPQGVFLIMDKSYV